MIDNLGPGFDSDRCLECMRRLWTLEANCTSYERYHADQHKTLKEVLDAAAMVLDERLDRMNEFREEARTVQQTYVRNDLYQNAHSQISDRLSSIDGLIKGLLAGLGCTAVVSVAAVILEIFHE